MRCLLKCVPNDIVHIYVNDRNHVVGRKTERTIEAVIIAMTTNGSSDKMNHYPLLGSKVAGYDNGFWPMEDGDLKSRWSKIPTLANDYRWGRWAGPYDTRIARIIRGK